MISHMHVVHTASKGSISFGGVIISIARVLGLDTKLATLKHLPPCSLDIQACRSMRFIRDISNRKCLLMVHNIVIDDIALPCPNLTNVSNEANWTYDLRAKPEDKLGPMDIHENVAANNAIDDGYGQRESGYLLYTNLHHTTPHIFLFHMHTPHIFMTVYKYFFQSHINHT